MKPILIRFKCFGPYMEEQAVDFSKLDRLFLIHGKTGAGKTTILDAIMFALYNESSSGERGSLESMRCKNATMGDETSVEFVFSEGAREYRFVRRLVPKRKKLDNEHNCFEKKDGEFVQMLDNPKPRYVTETAERITKLNAVQFRQVVILPQGRFEEFLTSSSEKKEETLVTIFQADRWQKYAQNVAEQVTARERELEREKERIGMLLKGAGCSGEEDLRQKEKEEEEHLLALKSREKEVESKEERFLNTYREASLLKEEFRKLDERTKRLTALSDRKEDMERKRAECRAAETADGIEAEYAAFREAVEQNRKAGDRNRKAVLDLESAVRQLMQAKEERTRHEAGQNAYRADSDRRAVLENLRPVYAEFGKKKDELDDKEAELEKKEKIRNGSEEAFKRENREWIDLQDRRGEASDRHREAFGLYRRNICGELAAGLKQGEPCPVCGAREHPSPAAASEDRQVTEAELDELNEKINTLSKMISTAALKRESAETKKKQAEQDFKQASDACAAARAAFQGAVAQLEDGIDGTDALNREIETILARIRTYEETGRDIREKISALERKKAVFEKEKSDSEEDLSAAADREKALKRVWNSTLLENGFENEDAFLSARRDRGIRKRFDDAIREFDGEYASAERELESQKENLAGKVVPDMEKAESDLASVRKEKENVVSDISLSEDRLGRIRETLKSLGDRIPRYEQEMLEMEGDREFYRKLRGDRGISLQRYVLGIMLGMITNEANRLLAGVYGGRYVLYRTNESTGTARKKGLELEVLDKNNAERRSVNTLSGGEKFIVSLSLSLGLASVVRSQSEGIRMDALFVDEGFGSLDHDSLGDAITMLQSVQGSDGTVGIISHVDELIGTVQSRIEAVKGSHGSHLRQSC